MPGFLVHTVSAGHGGVFVLEPNQEATDRIYLTVSSEAVGTVLVNNSLPIDFWVTDPSGTMLLGYDRFGNISFRFVADKNGNYTMHLKNAYQAQNVTVVLDYSLNFVVVLQESIKIQASAGVAKVASPPPSLSLPDIDGPDLDNLYEKYSNFQRASEILRALRDSSNYLPVRDLILMTYCFALVAGSIEIVRRRQPVTSCWFESAVL